MCSWSWPAKHRRLADVRHSTSTPSTSSRRSTSCSASRRPRCSRATRKTRSRARASPHVYRPERAGKGDAVLRNARPALDLPPGLAGLHAAPAHLGWGKFDQDVWELYDLEQDRAQAKNLAEQEPDRLEELKTCGSTTPASTTASHSTTAPPSSRSLAERPHAADRSERYVYFPDCADVPESAGVADQRAVVHDRRRESSSSARTRRACIFAHGGVAGGHSLFVKDRQTAATRSTGSGPISRTSSPTAMFTPADTCAAPSSRSQGPNDRSGDAGLRRNAQSCTWTTSKSGRARSSRNPGLLPRGRRICVGRDSASPVTPDYTAPFRFTGGTIDKVVVDVSGEPYIDHEAQVRAWFMRD